MRAEDWLLSRLGAPAERRRDGKHAHREEIRERTAKRDTAESEGLTEPRRPRGPMRRVGRWPGRA